MNSSLSVFISWGSSALASGYFLKMACLPYHIRSISCHMLGIFLAHVHFCSIYSLWELLFCLILLCQMYWSNVHGFSWHWILYCVFCGLHEQFCVLSVSALMVQANTCSVVITLVFLTVVNSYIIYVITSSLFMSLINCSFMSYLFSLYSHSFALIIRWSICSSIITLVSS